MAKGKKVFRKRKPDQNTYEKLDEAGKAYLHKLLEAAPNIKNFFLQVQELHQKDGDILLVPQLVYEFLGVTVFHSYYSGNKINTYDRNLFHAMNQSFRRLSLVQHNGDDPHTIGIFSRSEGVVVDTGMTVSEFSSGFQKSPKMLFASSGTEDSQFDEILDKLCEMKGCYPFGMPPNRFAQLMRRRMHNLLRLLGRCELIESYIKENNANLEFPEGINTSKLKFQLIAYVLNIEKFSNLIFYHISRQRIRDNSSNDELDCFKKEILDSGKLTEDRGKLTEFIKDPLNSSSYGINNAPEEIRVYMKHVMEITGRERNLGGSEKTKQKRKRKQNTTRQPLSKRRRRSGSEGSQGDPRFSTNPDSNPAEINEAALLNPTLMLRSNQEIEDRKKIEGLFRDGDDLFGDGDDPFRDGDDLFGDGDDPFRNYDDPFKVVFGDGDDPGQPQEQQKQHTNTVVSKVSFDDPGFIGYSVPSAPIFPDPEWENLVRTFLNDIRVRVLEIKGGYYFQEDEIVTQLSFTIFNINSHVNELYKTDEAKTKAEAIINGSIQLAKTICSHIMPDNQSQNDEETLESIRSIIVEKVPGKNQSALYRLLGNLQEYRKKLENSRYSSSSSRDAGPGNNQGPHGGAGGSGPGGDYGGTGGDKDDCFGNFGSSSSSSNYIPPKSKYAPHPTKQYSAAPYSSNPNEALLQASAAGDFGTVERMLELHEVDLEVFDLLERNAMHFAVMSGNLDLVQYLKGHMVIECLNEKDFFDEQTEEEKEETAPPEALFNTPDLYGRTPLHYAVACRDMDMIQLLLEENKIEWLSDEDLPQVDGGVIDKMGFRAGDYLAQDENGFTLLHEVAVQDDVARVKMLIRLCEHNPKLLNTKDRRGNTALDYAIINRKSEIAKSLIESGASIHFKRLVSTDFLLDLEEEEAVNIIEQWLEAFGTEAKPEVDAKALNSSHIVHKAIKQGKFALAEKLMNLDGFDPSVKNASRVAGGKTPRGLLKNTPSIEGEGGKALESVRRYLEIEKAVKEIQRCLKPFEAAIGEISRADLHEAVENVIDKKQSNPSFKPQPHTKVGKFAASMKDRLGHMFQRHGKDDATVASDESTAALEASTATDEQPMQQHRDLECLAKKIFEQACDNVNVTEDELKHAMTNSRTFEYMNKAAAYHRQTVTTSAAVAG